jgi:hypothetical protein
VPHERGDRGQGKKEAEHSRFLVEPLLGGGSWCRLVAVSTSDHAHAAEGCMFVEFLVKFALKVIVELAPLILGSEERQYQNRRDRNTYSEVGLLGPEPGRGHCWKGTILRRAESVQNVIHLHKIQHILE